MTTPRPCCAPTAPAPQRPAPPRQRVESGAGAGRPRRQVLVPGGEFLMGDHFDEGYPADGELPLHPVRIGRFRMDECAVTNAQFATFCKDTGYVTEAEQVGVSAVFHLAVEASAADVMHRLESTPWWVAVRGADWRHPGGPRSSITNLQNHPVVHVSWNDAVAYSRWAGARLPTEAEWEYAARGGLEGARFPWGDELTPRGRWNMNVWQGAFPTNNTLADGHLTTAPVRTYRPNGYGLHQMVGNVWEWCSDAFDPGWYSVSGVDDPRGPEQAPSTVAAPDTGSDATPACANPGDVVTWRVMRGGSYLCHDSYCYRYRVAARSSNTSDSATANIGFRCVRDL